MATPFKMKGHTLPGPNQKKSPANLIDFGLISGPLIAAAVSSAVGAGTKAISAAGQRKAAKKKKEQDERRIAAEETAAAMEQDIETKTKLV